MSATTRPQTEQKGVQTRPNTPPAAPEAISRGPTFEAGVLTGVARAREEAQAGANYYRLRVGPRKLGQRRP
jgi:hypothetical protein